MVLKDQLAPLIGASSGISEVTAVALALEGTPVAVIQA
jgi:NADP-dependent 3-hydroxy acid dehydrogenase YdfG